MTSEQNKQWQKAILPMALGFSEESRAAERTFATLLPRTERYTRSVKLLERGDHLTNWGVPYWATDLRSTLIFFEFESLEPWHWEFAIRSETALVGVQILNPNDKNRLPIYQRIFVRFVAEVLRPMVEYAHPIVGYRQRGYKPLGKLYELCEEFTPPGNAKDWPEPDHLFPPETVLVQSYEVGGAETYNVARAGHYALTEIRSIFDTGDGVIKESIECSDAWEQTSFLHDMTVCVNLMHRWRMGIDADSEAYVLNVYTEPMAQAYLAALEAECPPPDWLPRDGNFKSSA
ncbi:MAG: hypothetical protein QM758_05660 [Armatimonas sp.]